MGLSIKKVQDGSTAVFNELSERLYTLEVQKADADQELQQLQSRLSEQDGDLHVLRQQSMELRQHCIELRARLATATKDGLDAGTEASTTAETRSDSSSFIQFGN